MTDLPKKEAFPKDGSKTYSLVELVKGYRDFLEGLDVPGSEMLGSEDELEPVVARPKKRARFGRLQSES